MRLTDFLKRHQIGYRAAYTDSLFQQITIPSITVSANLSFWPKVDSQAPILFSCPIW
jgi:hypothetical protein